jgi:hypothetical protein
MSGKIQKLKFLCHAPARAPAPARTGHGQRQGHERRRLTLHVELLESRLTPAVVTVPLNPAHDQFGDQIVTVQSYGDPNHASFSFFDSGASAVTFSAAEQAALAAKGFAIPILNPGGAIAQGLGGGPLALGGLITGDVSRPGTTLADGLHAASMTFNPQGGVNFSIAFGPTSAATPGIQAFVGTTTGSPLLPTITGTPILEPSTINPLGLGADVLFGGDSLNFSSAIPGLTLSMPDLSFVTPSYQVSAANGTTDPLRIPMNFFGEDNYLFPGSQITNSPALIQPEVTLGYGGNSLAQQTFLFDTGAQLTVISTAEALALGLDLTHPTTSMSVTGVSGQVTIPGFTLDELDVPIAGGVLQFSNVPVYVLDFGAGINGLLGMNLFNNAHEMLFNPYDPSGPSVTLTFNTIPGPDSPSGPGDGLSPSDLAALGGMGVPFTGALDGQNVPGLTSPGTNNDTLTVTAKNIQTTEGANFSGTVGSFRDTDPAARSFTVTINWGDGNTQQGVLMGNGQGEFNVTGSHAYAEEGTYDLTVTVKDNLGRVASYSANAVVADAPLTVIASPIQLGEGRPFTGKVASLVDGDPRPEIADFTATIDWGDGQSSAGTLISIGGQAFDISGSHTYLEEGAYTLKITITDVGGSVGSATETVNVNDGFLMVTGVSLPPQMEGTSFTAVIAHFGDTDPSGALSDYSATIYWGDGTSTAGSIASNANGGFDVSGSHVYSASGTYNCGINVQDVGGAGGGTGGTIVVFDAPLMGSGSSFTAPSSGSTGSVLVATFTDAGGLAPPSNYSATINWGDGSSSQGTVTQPGGSGTPFNVTGSHNYPSPGSWTIHTTITDAAGSSVDVVSQVKVRSADAIVGRTGGGQIWVGMSNGSSSFSSGLWATWSSKVSWQNVQTADFNGDGKDDIIGRDPSTGAWWVGISNGSSFTTTSWGSWSTKVTWVDIHVADLNGDGKADLIGRVLQSGQWWASLSTGSSFTTSLWATWSTRVNWVDVQVADFNGDGKADLAGRAQSSGQWWIGQSTGSSLSTALWGTWNPSVTWVDVRTGDFNGDGKADLVGRVQQDGTWWLAQSTGFGFVNGYWGQWNPSVTWVDVQTGDFNGDGKTDLIGRVQQDGSWWLAQSTGSSFSNSLWAQWNPNVTWVDVQVGDFNGDGKSDLAGRVQSAGQWWTSLSGGSSSSATSLWATWSTAVSWTDVRCGNFG